MYIFTCTCINMYVCMHACMYVCMYACMYVVVNVRVYIYVCIYIRRHMYICIYIYTHACVIYLQVWFDGEPCALEPFPWQLLIPYITPTLTNQNPPFSRFLIQNHIWFCIRNPQNSGFWLVNVHNPFVRSSEHKSSHLAVRQPCFRWQADLDAHGNPAEP